MLLKPAEPVADLGHLPLKTVGGKVVRPAQPVDHSPKLCQTVEDALCADKEVQLVRPNTNQQGPTEVNELSGD